MSAKVIEAITEFALAHSGDWVATWEDEMKDNNTMLVVFPKGKTGARSLSVKIRTLHYRVRNTAGVSLLIGHVSSGTDLMEVDVHDDFAIVRVLYSVFDADRLTMVRTALALVDDLTPAAQIALRASKRS